MTATDDDHLRKFEGHHGGASNEEDDTPRRYRHRQSRAELSLDVIQILRLPLVTNMTPGHTPHRLP
jgi:hypothetical protein